MDRKKNKRTYIIAYTGIFLSLAIVLNILESMIPPIAFLPPGIKLGLSNIVTMYCLFFIGKSSAFFVTLLKSVFVLITRGYIAGLLSLTGGLCAIGIMILLIILFKNRSSYLLLSIFGGIFHNLGQITMASFILETPLLIYYLPFILVGGLIAGTLTAVLLRILMPALNKIQIK